MISKILFLSFLLLYLNASDSLVIKQQNALYIQNMIEIEENISEKFEEYLLTEFKIPTLENLISNEYLGSNFSIKNKMGSNIAFENTSNLQIKYAVTNDVELYVKQIYNRDLYRERTSVYYDSNTLSNSYVSILLKSDEAKNIFNILKSGAVIAKICSDSLVNSFCNKNSKLIRWYNSDSNWIEYSKKDYNNGNVTVKYKTMLSDTKLNTLPVGTYVFVQNGSKYIKLIGDGKILKVD